MAATRAGQHRAVSAFESVFMSKSPLSVVITAAAKPLGVRSQGSPLLWTYLVFRLKELNLPQSFPVSSLEDIYNFANKGSVCSTNARDWGCWGVGL